MSYMGKIYLENNFPKPLSIEETNKYSQLASNGDENAKKKLKEHNLRFVVYIVNRYFQNIIDIDPTIDSDDLFSIGTLGLINAVETFMIEKDTKFSTYASRCIVNEILKTLRKTKKRLINISLDNSLYNDGNEFTVFNTIDSGENIEENYIESELNKEVMESLLILEKREKQVVMMRFGIGSEIFSQSEVAKQLGVSQPNISRIEKKATEKIKELLVKKGYDIPKKIKVKNDKKSSIEKVYVMQKV